MFRYDLVYNYNNIHVTEHPDPGKKSNGLHEHERKCSRFALQ